MIETEKVEKNKKLSTILLISIAICFIVIIATIVLLLYIQRNVFHVYIDGVSIALPDDTIVIDQATGKIQVDIMNIASYLGYDSHKGEYKLFTEDSNKCWVDSKNETASFFLNSNKISKMPPDQTKNYEDYTIQEPVVSKNGKLYCSPEGIQIGFNVRFDYNKENNTIQIYTLPYLVQQYTAQFKTYGYSSLNSNFDNQKAILYDLFIVRKDNNLYGVVNSKNEEIISSRYSSMQFNENAKEFYVTNTVNKKGIVTKEGNTKINLLYDEINLIDQKNGLYMVKNNNKYGVLDNKGNIVIHLEYDQIGVDLSKFTNSNITNKYVLFDNAIPVYQNRKWGMFDIKGNIILPIKYDEIGYTKGVTGKVVNNLLVVPSFRGIVFGETRTLNDKNVILYGIFDYQGKELVMTALNNAYFITSAGVNTYYMEDYKGTNYNIEEYLQKLFPEKNVNGINPSTDDNVNETNNSTDNNVNGANTNNNAV